MYNVHLAQGGNRRAYILDRLDRDGHTELAIKVRANEMSAQAAAIAVGWRKPSSAFARVLKLCRVCPQDETKCT